MQDCQGTTVSVGSFEPWRDRASWREGIRQGQILYLDRGRLFQGETILDSLIWVTCPFLARRRRRPQLNSSLLFYFFSFSSVPKLSGARNDLPCRKQRQGTQLKLSPFPRLPRWSMNCSQVVYRPLLDDSSLENVKMLNLVHLRPSFNYFDYH